MSEVPWYSPQGVQGAAIRRISQIVAWNKVRLDALILVIRILAFTITLLAFKFRHSLSPSRQPNSGIHYHPPGIRIPASTITLPSFGGHPPASALDWYKFNNPHFKPHLFRLEWSWAPRLKYVSVPGLLHPPSAVSILEANQGQMDVF